MTEKYHEIIFEYIDKAVYRGESQTPEEAITRLQELVKENNVKGVKVISVTEVDTLYPEDMNEDDKKQEKRTLN